MPKISQKVLFPATLLLSAAIVGAVLWQAGRSHGPEVERTGFQGADVPPGMPASGVPDFRFHQLSAWQRAEVPRVVRWEAPLGADGGALTTVALADRAEAEGSSPRAGVDLEMIGGANVSLGEPVRAVGDGLVIFAGEPSPEWGGVVVLAHLDAEGNPLQSLYGYLGKIDVAHGALVARGTKLGHVGTANGHHPARLHFQMLRDWGVDLGAGESSGTRNRLDPLAALGEVASPTLPSPLALLMADPGDGWTELEIRNSERFAEILAKPEE